MATRVARWTSAPKSGPLGPDVLDVISLAFSVATGLAGLVGGWYLTRIKAARAEVRESISIVDMRGELDTVLAFVAKLEDERLVERGRAEERAKIADERAKADLEDSAQGPSRSSARRTLPHRGPQG